MSLRDSLRGRLAVALIALATLGLIAAVVHAAAAQQPPPPAPAPPASRATAAAGSCLECHGTVTKHTVLHPKTTDCASCHVPTARDAHQFKDKQCIACHTQMAKPNEKFVHGPVAAGECLACHAPHGSEEPQQVRVFGPELCERCHVDIKSQLAEKRFTHDPVKEDCATCHDPHASAAKYQIRTESADQCLQCHKTLRKQLVTSRVQHEAVSMGKQCVNCHDPHSSNLSKQLKATSMELCLSCHDREVETPNGKVQNIKGWIEKHTDLHGPLRQQDCVGCHLPHDSQHFLQPVRSQELRVVLHVPRAGDGESGTHRDGDGIQGRRQEPPLPAREPRREGTHVPGLP